MATEDQLAAIASWAGTEAVADPEAIDARLARLGDPHAAAFEIMGEQLGQMAANPNRLDTDGIAAADWSTSMRVLQARRGELRSILVARAKAGALTTATAAALGLDITEPRGFVQVTPGRSRGDRPDGR